jgi:hypothetical protein
VGRSSVAGLCLGIAGCGGGEAQVAERNRTFYAYDSASKELADLFEQAYPPLDKANDKPEVMAFKGVTVLSQHVHLSRPVDWVMRRASNEPGQRFVQYVSPKEYVFSVYEWPDHADAPWREVIARYEDAVRAQKAEILDKRMPMATHNAQVRGYVIRRRVPAAKQAFENTSLELLARSDKRVVLVQVVHQGDSATALEGDLLRVINTLTLD